ncbi:MAG: phosphate ABC transporter substrate-binding protein PstS [Dehalococcoidia bacterium]
MRVAQIRWWKAALLALAISSLALFAVACGDEEDSDEDTTATATAAAGTGTAAASATPAGIASDLGKNDSAQITGAGATFPAPIYQAWFDDYNKKVAKGVQVNYQSIGSGGGIQQFTEGTVLFGASDAPMSDAELAKVPDAVHIPMVLGSVVVTYNISGLTTPLKFDGDTLAKIYLGTIKKWNDPAIAALNSGAKLPDADIQVVYRSDGSGTTFVWTDYLTAVSADWKSKVGVSKNPSWPVGQGGKGNEGVSNAVRQTPNAIGYVELNYAIETKLAFADVKNQAGKFVTPSIDGTSAAAAGVTLPPDYRVSIVNAKGDTSYPIASFTYLLVHKNTSSCDEQKPLVNMLWWIFHDKAAADTAKTLNYAPLPAGVLPNVEATLKGLTCNGQPILPKG